MYLPRTGQTAGLYVESPIEARGGVRLGGILRTSWPTTGTGDITQVKTAYTSSGCNSGNCDLQTIDGSGSGLDADKLDGYNSAETGASKILRTASSGYLLLDNWMRVGGGGIYSSTNSAHLTPETNTYGTWKTTGSKGGYDGISFASAPNYPTLMFSTGNNGYGGIYYQSGRWALFYNYAADTMHIGSSSGNLVWHSGNDGSGSGLDADKLDGSHASSFASSSHSHDSRYFTETESDSRFINTAGDTVTGTLVINGNLQANANTRQSCGWTGSGHTLACSDGKFVAGVQFVSVFSGIKLYCCEL